MIADYPRKKQAEHAVIETIYEPYESSFVAKSICTCGWLSKIDAECIFYDANDKVISSIKVSNNLAYLQYDGGNGIIVSDKGNRVVLPSCLKGETTCYSVSNGSIVWKCSQKDIDRVFIYGDKLYASCIHTRSKGSLQLINANTGEQIKELLFYSTKMSHPSFFRLSERYLLVYITERFFVYDMTTDELLITQVRHTALDDYELCRLEKVLPIQNSSEVLCRFADFVSTYDERGIIASAEWKKSEIILKISDLLDGAKPSPFGNKIPTDKKSLDRA
jgi:outer membrane protein assembly factor BamB